MAKLDCFNRVISQLFYRYGRLIGRNPLLFLVIPLIIAGCLGSGMLFLTIETDAAYLFTPDDSRAKEEFEQIHTLFPVDHKRFLPNRVLTTQELGGSVVITRRDKGNILRQEVMEEIIHLDRVIKAIEIRSKGSNTSVTYSDICCHFTHDECLDDPVLKFFNYTAENVNTVNLTYPFSYIKLFDSLSLSSEIPRDLLPDLFPEIPQLGQDFLESAIPDLSFLIPDGPNNISINIGASLGDVTFYDNTDIVKSARAMTFMYFLRGGSEEEIVLAQQWEKQFLNTLLELQPHFAYIEVAMFASSTLSDELIAMATRILPRFCITFTLLIMFAIGTCMMADWVLSKPWLGQCGVISAMLAIASSMGLLSYIGLPFNEVSASMPFLAIGIGIDDMFIMLAAWRKTSVKLPVEERMGQTYAEAAVSITITSITDALAFGIGSITKLPAIRVFCLYSGVAILFDFLYQISFFGACMVFTGRREANNKHCTTLKHVVPKDEARSKIYRLFCAGGVSKESPTGEPDDHALMGFFKNHYGPLITTPVAKVLTVILYATYIGVSVYGCFSLTEGMQYKDIFSDDSYAHHYMIQRADYFTAFSPPVAVVVTEPVAYWEKDVQDQVEKLTREVEDLSNIYGERFTTSWLREYTKYLKEQGLNAETSNDTELDKHRFLSVLQEDFLTNPLNEQYLLDLKFENVSGATTIAASRLILLPGNITTTVEEANLMVNMREVIDGSPLPVMVSSPPFEFFEQYLVVLPNTIQNLIIATVCMCLISVVFIPHPVTAVMITLCVISIEVGVIGFMSLWDVSMDGVSMINIILCIGFSVDFSAHMAYSFVTAPCDTGNEAAIFALHSVGMPIFQGAASTILGITAIATSPAYIFRSFFKTMFLVMVFGFLHGILFLPILLTILRPCMRQKRTVPVYDCKEPPGDIQKTDHDGLSDEDNVPVSAQQGQEMQTFQSDEKQTESNDAVAKETPQMEEVV